MCYVFMRLINLGRVHETPKLSNVFERRHIALFVFLCAWVCVFVSPAKH